MRRVSIDGDPTSNGVYRKNAKKAVGGPTKTLNNPLDRGIKKPNTIRKAGPGVAGYEQGSPLALNKPAVRKAPINRMNKLAGIRKTRNIP